MTCPKIYYSDTKIKILHWKVDRNLSHKSKYIINVETKAEKCNFCAKSNNKLNCKNNCF